MKTSQIAFKICLEYKSLLFLQFLFFDNSSIEFRSGEIFIRMYHVVIYYIIVSHYWCAVFGCTTYQVITIIPSTKIIIVNNNNNPCLDVNELNFYLRSFRIINNIQP